MASRADNQHDRYKVHKKLTKLPHAARVSKRPIPRPLVTSEYASKTQPKVVYVSTKTHFMSAVKRIEKLLRRSETRAVQSATTKVRALSRAQRQQQGQRSHQDDEIMRVATALHEVDQSEAVIAKGTGKAIVKTMQVGLWFQERPEYAVVLKTASVGAIDDISIASPADASNLTQPPDSSKASAMDLEESKPGGLSVFELDQAEADTDDNEYTRIRQLSVLEVHIRLR